MLIFGGYNIVTATEISLKSFSSLPPLFFSKNQPEKNQPAEKRADFFVSLYLEVIKLLGGGAVSEAD